MDSERLAKAILLEETIPFVQHHVLIRKGERVLKETAYSKMLKNAFREKNFKEESIYTDEKGTKVIGVHSYFPDTDWCLVSEIDADEAFSVLQKS